MANYDSTHTGATIDSAVSQVTDSTTDFNVDSNTLVVDKSANSVGIGVAAPATKLNVETSGLDYISITDSGTNVVRMGDLHASNKIGVLELFSNGTLNTRLVGDTGDSYFKGSVGIGTDAPSDALEVKGSTAKGVLVLSSGDTTITGNDVVGQINFKDYDADAHVGGDQDDVISVKGIAIADAARTTTAFEGSTAEGYELAFSTSKRPSPNAAFTIAEAMRISMDGNVGIGSASPNTDLSFGSATATISQDTSDASDNQLIKICGGGAASATRGAVFAVCGNENTTFGVGGDVYISPGDVSGAQVAIDATIYVKDGKVGIGNDSPAYPLHIKGGSAHTYLAIDNSADGYDATLLLRQNNSTKGLVSYDDSSNTMSFIYGTDPSATTGIHIDSSGNVGINEASPAHTLEVGGDIGVAGNYLLEEQGRQDHVANTMPAPYYRFVTDDYIQIADDPSLDGFTKFSITARINPEQVTAAAGIISKYATGGQRAWTFYYDANGNLVLGITTDGTTSDEETTTTTPITTAGIWYDLAVTFDAGAVVFYVNGVVQADDGGMALTSVKAGTDPVLIGARLTNSTNNFDGEIAGCQIWNKVLTATEVKELSSGASVPFKYKGANQTALVTGTNNDMSGANSWANNALATLDINTTEAGKMYMLGDGAFDRADLDAILTIGKSYYVTLKAKLNAGASTTIRVGGTLATVGSDCFEITPTGTETTFTGTFVAKSTDLQIGLDTAEGGFDGIAFEIDDVTCVQIGAVAEYDGSGASDTVWYDKSGNDLNGTVSGATLENKLDTIQTSGITFPATAHASSNANTLDDYEEGLFTPTVIGATSGEATYSAGNQYGSYTKIGRMVNVNVLMGISDVNTLNGQILIGGLPFTVGDIISGSSLEASGSIGYFLGMTNAISSLLCTAVQSSTNVKLFMIDGGSATDISSVMPADIDNDWQCRISITYYV